MGVGSVWNDCTRTCGGVCVSCASVVCFLWMDFTRISEYVCGVDSDVSYTCMCVHVCTCTVVCGYKAYTPMFVMGYTEVVTM